MRSLLTTVLAYLFGVNVEIDGRSYGPPKPQATEPPAHSDAMPTQPPVLQEAEQPAAEVACH
jgi:hypothetical protein